MLFPAGTRDENVYGSWVLCHKALLMLAALASISIWSLVRAASFSERKEWRAVALGLPTVLGSLLLSRVAPPFIGRSLPILLLAAAVVLARRQERTLALYLGLASYCWVSRDFDYSPWSRLSESSTSWAPRLLRCAEFRDLRS